MNFMSFLSFLVAAFSVLNAALLPLNPDDSDLLSTSSPLLDSPPPDSVPLNLPAPGNDPISFDLNLNAITSDKNPTFGYTPKLAQGPSEDSAGEGGLSLIVPPSTTYAETHMDESNGICIPESSTGQNRRKRQPANCPNPAMLEFYSHVPKGAEPSGTKLSEKQEKAKKADDMVRRDNGWLLRLLRSNHLSDWEQITSSELQNELINLSNDDDDHACIKQPVPTGSYPRPYSLCCLGPPYTISLPVVGQRLARRQDPVMMTNWYNCQPQITVRPFCLFYMDASWMSNFVCCRTWSASGPDLGGFEPDNWWRWGYQGVDCRYRHEP